MSIDNIENTIREIVRQEIQTAFANIVPGKTVAAVPPKGPKIVKTQKVKATKKAVEAAATPSPFSVGQKVSYRQGRGTFEAEVEGFDGVKVLVKRLSDGKVSGRLPGVLKAA